MKFEHFFRLACVLAVMLPLPAKVAGQIADDTKLAAVQPKTWIFLIKGRSTEGIERSEVEKMQAAHIANFVRLAGIGKLFAAGPMTDPERKLRGIVVLTGVDRTEMDLMFATDPFIKEGILTLEASPLTSEVGEINVKLDAKKLDEYRIAILAQVDSDDKVVDSETAIANLAYSKSIHNDSRLVFFGTLGDAKSLRRAVLIFKSTDDKLVEELSGNFPAVKNGKWKATVMPIFLTEGTFDSNH